MNGTLTSSYSNGWAVLGWPRWNLGRTPVFDWLFIVLGGIPLFLPFLFFMGESGLSKSAPVYWYFWMNAVISAPHVYSTYCRLGRKIGEGKVTGWMGFPCYALCVGLLALASVKGFFLQAMTGVNVWQSVHYVRQVYGVSRLYGRGEFADARVRRLSYYAFHLSMPLFVLGRWHTLYTVWGGRPSTTIIPVHFSATVMTTCWVAGCVAVVAGIVSEVLRYRRSMNGYDPTLAVILGVFYTIHAFGFMSVKYYQRGFFAVTIFHAIQYLGLVWTLERHQALGWIHQALSSIPNAVSFPLFWGIIYVLGHAFETYLLPSSNRLWPMLATVALAAVSAHHYAVDTVMWRRQAGL